MKNFFAPIALFALICFASCKHSPFPGYEAKGGGSYMKIISAGKGTVLADTGGAVFFKLKLFNLRDSLIQDMNAMTGNPSLPLKIVKPKFKGDFFDLLAMLHSGDSSRFYISVDTLNKYYPGEFKFPKPNDTLKYVCWAVHVDSVYSRKQLTDFITNMQAQQQAMQQKQQEYQMKKYAIMGPIQKRAKAMEPMLKKKDAQLMKTWLAKNKMAGQPDANGIYFMQTSPGNGDPVMPGDFVSVRYTGKYLNDSIFDSNCIMPDDSLMRYDAGMQEMIAGFDDCVLKMKKGGKATFVLPPKMGYNDSITRVFDVEVVDVQKGNGRPHMPMH